MRKSISSGLRKDVYAKFNGHCAYCGCEITIKQMQVDHIKSVYKSEIHGIESENDIDNYYPACRQCNFYKSTFDIEVFRTRLTTVMIENLRKNFNYRLALKYGLIEEHIEPIKFYFEKVGH